MKQLTRQEIANIHARVFRAMQGEHENCAAEASALIHAAIDASVMIVLAAGAADMKWKPGSPQTIELYNARLAILRSTVDAIESGAREALEEIQEKYSRGCKTGENN